MFCWHLTSWNFKKQKTVKIVALFGCAGMSGYLSISDFRVFLQCGTKFWQLLIFPFFFIYDLWKKKSPKRSYQKKFLCKNLLHCQNYIKTSPSACNVKLCLCPFTFVHKHNEITNKKFRNMKMKLQLVHYKYLAAKSLKEKDCLKVLHWLTY